MWTTIAVVVIFLAKIFVVDFHDGPSSWRPYLLQEVTNHFLGYFLIEMDYSDCTVYPRRKSCSGVLIRSVKNSYVILAIRCLNETAVLPLIRWNECDELNRTRQLPIIKKV